MSAPRGQWNSKIGFIMAAAGSAIGLGNIWRFPYVTGENGGGAFVLFYVIFVVLIGLPYMYAELALGRATQQNPVGAIEKIRPKSFWRMAGFLGVITGVGILSFYAVIAGWTVAYIYKMFVGQVGGFGAFVADPWSEISLFALFVALTSLIVQKGVSEGIERWSKILMPLFFILLLALVIYAMTLDGAGKGLEFYLKPDFSKITGRTLLAALGQAFFSLSLGMGTMITYGSYLSKNDNLVTSGVSVALFDTLIALFAGLIIFPALFTMGKDPSAGPTLVFVVLPELFAQMPGGLVVGALFFVLLTVAALTSTISLLEVPVSYLIDDHKMDRKTIVWIVAGITFLLGLPSALSQGASEFFSNFGLIPASFTSADFLSQMSFIFGDIALAVGAISLSIFVGWVWGIDKAADEVEKGAPLFAKTRGLWKFIIRFVIPLVILLVLLNTVHIF
ncbi:MAG: sodium-dependent transporter [Calditrichaeota bacterium]|nr:MAG: sodium-dependent transporter [Calditrichota bacterium]